ncbi:hypothetical protein Clacol_004366 [Clathrus columnatus]|uniref:Uncharacterized protein n=1 Tax=Clathrus columnatus TaxID=1419009 RepID=A0AAV5A784_9AGAM|nr:hypothetical protein Clacol_004366 [Clathrus columnatus]
MRMDLKPPEFLRRSLRNSSINWNTSNVAIILLDISAFLAVIRQVWDLWKEKRRLNLHTDKDFATLLLQQGTLRFSHTAYNRLYFSSRLAGSDVGAFQNVLSLILICEFTLDLRQRNTTGSLPNPSALELSDLNLSIRNNPENIIADMGERNDRVNIDGTGPGEEEPDHEIA